MDLTVQVLHLSPNMTLGDLTVFFSYCGTVHEIQLPISMDGEPPKSALVTFSEPTAYQTALLLNDAIFAGQPIKVLPRNVSAKPPDKQTEVPGIIPATKAAIQAVSSGVREELDRARSLVRASEEAAGHMAFRIMNHDYVSSGTTWVSGVLEQAFKRVSDLGNFGRWNNTTFGKQK